MVHAAVCGRSRRGWTSRPFKLAIPGKVPLRAMRRRKGRSEGIANTNQDGGLQQPNLEYLDRLARARLSRDQIVAAALPSADPRRETPNTTVPMQSTLQSAENMNTARGSPRSMKWP